MKNKIISKFSILIFIIIWILFSSCTPGWVVNIRWTEHISGVSIEPNSWATIDVVKETWFSLLWSLKMILFAIFIFYLVYAWVRLILSLWTDEEKISAAKRQIWYALIWIIFVNFPWTIYDAFFKTSQWNIRNTTNWTGEWTGIILWNWFYNFLWFIVWWLEIIIFFSALIILIFTWLKFIIKWKDPNSLEDDKKRLFYWFIVLLFVWFIALWRRFAFTWDLKIWYSILWTIINMMLYVAPVIAFFFILLAWYYMITSSWDKEKWTKAKNIILYVLLWTIIFLATFTILIEIDNIKL